jgi:uncharacterized membrane protein YkoI
MLVSIEKLKVGALIKSEIKDNTNKVVVKAGSKMTPLLLKRLESWGVKAVDIEPDPEEIAKKAAIENKIIEKKPQTVIDKELVIKIAKKFSNVREDPLMDKIMRLSIKHLSNRQTKTK